MPDIRDILSRRPAQAIVAIVVLAFLAVVTTMLFQGHRKPPSIFDSPIDNVFGYLALDDFSRLSVEERVRFLADLAKRFPQLQQSESAVAAAFIAGLTGPAREQVRTNARILAKDVLVQGADGFLALDNDTDRAKYLDQWLTDWIRLGREVEGRENARPESDELDRVKRDARRDADRTIARNVKLDAGMAVNLMNFWEGDVASVANPAEQGKIFAFLPALRNHLLQAQ